MPRIPREKRDPWALAFADAIHSWLAENGMAGMDLAEILDIPKSTWEHAAAADTITQVEYYARIFCYTGVAAADPRSLPPRRLAHNTIPRAMTQQEWEEWLELHHEAYLPVNVLEVADDQSFSISAADELDPDGQVLDELLRYLQTALEQQEEELERFLRRNRQQLSQLYQLISIFTIENSQDRLAALKARRRYTKS